MAKKKTGEPRFSEWVRAYGLSHLARSLGKQAGSRATVQCWIKRKYRPTAKIAQQLIEISSRTTLSSWWDSMKPTERNYVKHIYGVKAPALTPWADLPGGDRNALREGVKAILLEPLTFEDIYGYFAIEKAHINIAAAQTVAHAGLSA